MRRSTPLTFYGTRPVASHAFFSLRRHLHGHINPARRRLLKRMRCKVDLGDQRHMGGPDRICERLLIATLWVWGRLQVDPHAMRADDLRRMPKASIQLA